MKVEWENLAHDQIKSNIKTIVNNIVEVEVQLIFVLDNIDGSTIAGGQGL